MSDSVNEEAYQGEDRYQDDGAGPSGLGRRSTDHPQNTVMLRKSLICYTSDSMAPLLLVYRRMTWSYHQKRNGLSLILVTTRADIEGKFFFKLTEWTDREHTRFTYGLVSGAKKYIMSTSDRTTFALIMND